MLQHTRWESIPDTLLSTCTKNHSSTLRMLPVQHKLAIIRPVHLLVQLNPSILHILPSPKPVVRARRRQLSSRLDMAGEGAGKGLSYPAQGVGEQDVGDWEIGA